MTDDKALRFNAGKPELSYLDMFPAALAGVARTLMYGTQREREPYPKFNWRKGDSALSIYDSARRHMLAWINGEDFDVAALADGWEIHNLDSAIGNLLRLRQQLADGVGEDDRPSAPKAPLQAGERAAPPEKEWVRILIDPGPEAEQPLKAADLHVFHDPPTPGEIVCAESPTLHAPPHEHAWVEVDTAERHWRCACDASISLASNGYIREDNGRKFSTWYEAAHAR